MSFFKNLLEALSKGKRDTINEKVEILGNVVGFYRSDNGVMQSQLVLEIARILSSKDIRVCIVSTDPQNDFYVCKYIDKLVKANNDDEDNEIEIPSVINRFMSSACELSSCLNDLEPNLKFLGFGLAPYSSTLSMDLDNLISTYTEVKDNFDVVLVDITNNPYLESTVAGLSVCDRVYNMIDFTPTPFLTEKKIHDYYSMAGLNNKLSSTVINNVPYGYTIKDNLNSSMLSSIIMEIPAIDNISMFNLEHGPMLPQLNGKAGVGYSLCVEHLVNEILNGLGGGKSNDDTRETTQS